MNENVKSEEIEHPESSSSQQTPSTGKRRLPRVSFSAFEAKTLRLDQSQEVQPIVQTPAIDFQVHVTDTQAHAIDFQAQSQQQNTEMDNELNRLRIENKKQYEHLIVYAKLINELEAKCAEKEEKLKEKNDTIKKLQEQKKELEQRNFDLMTSKNSADEEPQDEISESGGQRTEKAIESVEELEDYAMEKQDDEEYNKAITYWKKATEKEEKDQNRPSKLAEFFANKAECHGKLNQREKQVDAASSALHYDPNSVLALRNRAWGNYNLKNYYDAKVDFEKLVELKPINITARNGLNKIQKKNNDQLDE